MNVLWFWWAVIQGISEFLPVSSSLHLQLFTARFGAEREPGLHILAAMNLATLAATVIYFLTPIRHTAAGFFRYLLRGKRDHTTLAQAGYALMITAATVPAVIAGYALHTGDVKLPESPWTLGGFGLLMWAADRYALRTFTEPAPLSLRRALLIGLAQVIAFLPGASRLGITFTAARALGMSRGKALEFSMLLSIPTVLGAALMQGLKAHEQGAALLTGESLMMFASAMLWGLVSIRLAFPFIKRRGVGVFALYRVILAILLAAGLL